MPGTATAADLRRHPRRRPAAVLARAGFAPVSATGRGEKTPPHAPPRHRLRALPSRLNGQSRAKDVDVDRLAHVADAAGAHPTFSIGQSSQLKPTPAGCKTLVCSGPF